MLFWGDKTNDEYIARYHLNKEVQYDAEKTEALGMSLSNKVGDPTWEKDQEERKKKRDKMAAKNVGRGPKTFKKRILAEGFSIKSGVKILAKDAGPGKNNKKAVD